MFVGHDAGQFTGHYAGHLACSYAVNYAGYYAGHYAIMWNHIIHITSVITCKQEFIFQSE